MKTQNIFIAQPKTNEQASALKAFMQALKIKFEISNQETYNSEFVERVLQGKKDIEAGRFSEIEPKNIKDFVDSL